MISETDRAYLAGILDGEGCIRLANRGKYVTPSVQVANTKYELMLWLQERYGGSIYQLKDSRDSNRKQSWSWNIAGQKALTVIRDARPYLVLKTEQADIVLETKRHCAVRDESGRLVATMTDADFAYNRLMMDRIAELNKRGVA